MPEYEKRRTIKGDYVEEIIPEWRKDYDTEYMENDPYEYLPGHPDDYGDHG